MTVKMYVEMRENYPCTDVEVEMTLSDGDRSAWYDFMKCRGPVSLFWDAKAHRLIIQTPKVYETKEFLECRNCHAWLLGSEISEDRDGYDGDCFKRCPWCMGPSAFDLMMPVRFEPGGGRP